MSKKWIKPRHMFFNTVARPVFWLAGKLKYGLVLHSFKEQGKRNYCILTNHQTPMDQMFCSLLFKRPVYYIATEDLFSNGLISRLLEWSVAPIPIDKTKTDISTIRTAMRIAKEGGNVALAPEGNRTYSGQTCVMKSSVAKFVKALKLPLAFVLFEGGYGVCPRWSDKTRKGKMHVRVSKVLEYEDYAHLSDEELFDVIKKALWLDEAESGQVFESRKKAEYLERAIYTCPVCNGFAVWESNGNKAHCKKCGATVEYCADLHLSSENVPYGTMAEWMQAQNNYLYSQTLDSLTGKLLFTDKNVTVSAVIPYKHKKKLCKNVTLQLYGNFVKVEADGTQTVWMFEDIAGVAVMGRNKLNINVGEDLYQFKGDKHFNALKYMQIWYQYKNLNGGAQNGFIGI